MALNFPGPQQLRIYYTVDAVGLGNLQHVLQLNLDCDPVPTPGDAFVDVSVKRRAAANVDLETLTDSLVVLLQPLLDADDATIDYAELWAFAALSFDATYISSYTIGVAGTGTGQAFAAAQSIYSFRSLEGGVMRVNLMENNTFPGPSIGYASMSAANQAFVDFFAHPTNAAFLARDTSYPIAFTLLHPGTNEALFKRRYRR